MSIENEDYIDNNEVYDEVDAAQMLQIAQNNMLIEEHSKKLEPEKHPDFDGETCIDCGDDIPKERLAWGRIRCTYCQEKLEERNKMYRR